MSEKRIASSTTEFVHLHVHTEYSMMDGMIRVPQLIERAVEFGMPAVAITDHGLMSGVVEFCERARKAAIKPIIGLELCVAKSDPAGDAGGVATGNPLVLLASNDTGYRNLLCLSTAANHAIAPSALRVDKARLRNHAAGLIALSGCLEGEVGQKVLRGDAAGAEVAAAELHDIFGAGNFYLELLANGLQEQERANRALIELSRKTGIPLVATNDCHYLEPGEAAAHEVLRCIQAGRMVADIAPGQPPIAQRQFQPAEEMARIFAGVPEAIRATVEIAERCNVELNLGGCIFPKVEVPEGQTQSSYLCRLAGEGLVARIAPGPCADRMRTYQDRLDYELDVIERRGASVYLLTLRDIVEFARTDYDRIGPGRGAAPGSLALFALGITDVDPVEHGLLSECFLDPERACMPEIGLDIEPGWRELVIGYVQKKHGEDHIAGIMAFDRISAKSAILDAGKVLGMAPTEIDTIAGFLPLGGADSICRSLAAKPCFRKLCAANPQVARLLNAASSIEGLPCGTRRDASGVVISAEALTDLVPLCRSKDGQPLIQFSSDDIQRVGLAKFDLHELNALLLIRHTEMRIRSLLPLADKTFSVADVPLNDPAIYKLLREGLTSGIFQLDSDEIRKLLVKLRPETFEDLVALNALNRPGPLAAGFVELFVNLRQRRQPVQYRHPILREILEPTFGLPIYQEQVMQVAAGFAGYSLSEAIEFRKVLGKKRSEDLARQKEKFIAGATAKQGVLSGLAEEIFDETEHFASYSFSKAHSTGYAMLTYRTAWLKAHYPMEFMAALLTSEAADTETIVRYIAECHEKGVPVGSAGEGADTGPAPRVGKRVN